MDRLLLKTMPGILAEGANDAEIFTALRDLQDAHGT
jgi:hypothetical protein